MSAKVKPGFIGWVGFCRDCNETLTGVMSAVDLWAAYHNATNHKEAAK